MKNYKLDFRLYFESSMIVASIKWSTIDLWMVHRVILSSAQATLVPCKAKYTTTWETD